MLQLAISYDAVCLGETRVSNDVSKVCRNKSRNRRENALVLEKQWTHGCCHIGFPKSCYDGKHANVSDVSTWVEVKVDHDCTKNFQDGSLIVAFGNGPQLFCSRCNLTLANCKGEWGEKLVYDQNF